MARRWVGLPLQSSAARMVFEPAGVTVLGYVDTILALSFSFLSRRCVAQFASRGLGRADLLAGRFEHDNIKQPAIMLGRKPGQADWSS